MKFILSLMVSLTFLFSSFAQADCQATVYLKDWQGGFKNQTSGFDWCFEKASQWGLDLSDGWKARYCSSKTTYDSYGKVTGYDFLFFHRDRDYSSKYSRSIFYTMDLDYSERIHNGYSSRIEVVFSPSCGDNGGYDY